MRDVKRRKPVVPQQPDLNQEEIVVLLRDCAARSKTLRDNRSELTAKYPDQWVGLGDNWEFVVAATHEEVLAKLKDCGGYSPHSVIEWLETNPPKRIPTAWRRRTQ